MNKIYGGFKPEEKMKYASKLLDNYVKRKLDNKADTFRFKNILVFD